MQENSKSIFSELREKLLSNNKLYNKLGEINSNLRKMLAAEDNNNIDILYPHITYSAAIYCLINGIEHSPGCIECGLPVKTFYGKNLGFSKFCSLQCSRKNDISKIKRIETNIKKYGVSNPKKNADIINKTQQNNIKKYGVTSPSQLPEIQSKISNSLKTNYKNNHDEIINKRELTFLNKYGIHPNSTEKIKTKKIEDTLIKYGVEHTTQLESTKLKSKSTLIEKYGVDHYSKTLEARELLKLRNDVASKESADKFLNAINGVDTSLLTREEISLLVGLSFSATCVKLRELELPVKEINQDKVSSIEFEIVEFIKSLGITEIISNDRSKLNGKELDILLPNNKLAIEVDGIYWHSEKFGKDKDYHLNKTLQCDKIGIQLLHIFDIEWADPIKKKIWKSMIMSRLGMNKKIHGRKCILRSVDMDVATEFCNNNHLHGYKGGTVRLGLYADNTLVQLIILGKPRYNKKYVYELIRAVTLQGYTVVGGLSKMLSRVPESIISYADRRYSSGAGYKSIGMYELSATNPNYFYVSNGMLESRLKYQKHKLENILEIFDNSKSETYNMISNGYYRIWDCGNLVFTNKEQINETTRSKIASTN